MGQPTLGLGPLVHYASLTFNICGNVALLCTKTCGIITSLCGVIWPDVPFCCYQGKPFKQLGRKICRNIAEKHL